MISIKKMMAAIAILGFCVSMSVSEGKPLVEVTLVSEGRPCASIVIAQNPTPSAGLAALEIQYHIRKITGALLLQPEACAGGCASGSRLL